MRYGRSPIVLAVALLAMAPQASAQAQSTWINGLEDVSFGTIAASTDQSNSQNVNICSSRGWLGRVTDYSVTASGTGAGGAFRLSSGADSIPFDVQWVDSPNQSGGTMLQPGVPQSGFGNAAPALWCFGEPDTASLTVTIRAGDLAVATAGNYAGSLQIMIRPE